MHPRSPGFCSLYISSLQTATYCHWQPCCPSRTPGSSRRRRCSARAAARYGRSCWGRPGGSAWSTWCRCPGYGCCTAGAWPARPSWSTAPCPRLGRCCARPDAPGCDCESRTGNGWAAIVLVNKQRFGLLTQFTKRLYLTTCSSGPRRPPTGSRWGNPRRNGSQRSETPDKGPSGGGTRSPRRSYRPARQQQLANGTWGLPIFVLFKLQNEKKKPLCA